MKTNSDFSDAKVGDLVTSLRHGHGIIFEIDQNGTYPINVEFTNEPGQSPINEYTTDGYWHISEFAPTLFKGHIAIDSLQVTYNTLPDAS